MTDEQRMKLYEAVDDVVNAEVANGKVDTINDRVRDAWNHLDRVVDEIQSKPPGVDAVASECPSEPTCSQIERGIQWTRQVARGMEHGQVRFELEEWVKRWHRELPGKPGKFNRWLGYTNGVARMVGWGKESIKATTVFVLHGEFPKKEP